MSTSMRCCAAMLGLATLGVSCTSAPAGRPDSGGGGDGDAGIRADGGPVDADEPSDAASTADTGTAADGCAPGCAGRACGDDGCGGSCGDCAADERCSASFACVPASSVDCSTYPYDPGALLAELEGYGRHTTGGDPTNVYHVTNTDPSGPGSLRAGLESTEPYWIVFDVGVTSPAIIDLGPGDDEAAVEVQPNRTIDGRGRDVTIDGAIKSPDGGMRNVIFTDVRMTNTHGTRCTQAGDVVSLRSDGGLTPADFPTRDVWFHHIEMFEGGDGLIDIRGGSRVTISWSHFRDHSKGFLLSQESATDLEGAEMEVTFHHDYFARLSRRAPQAAQGRVHMYNNYHYQWWEFAVAGQGRSQLLSERNVYEARPGTMCGALPFITCRDPAPCGDEDWMVSKVALTPDWDASTAGYVRSDGDLLLEDAVATENMRDRVFTPDYPYTAEIADTALLARVRDESGPRTTYCR